MRIRKRFPLSHPHLNRPLITSPPPSDPPNHPQPSDQVPDGRPRCVSSEQELGSNTTSLHLKQKEGEETYNDSSIIGATQVGIGFHSTTDIEVVPSKKSKPFERDMKMKPKPSKQFFRKCGLDELQQCNGNKDSTSVGEGLRCSRANGRGWRCSQKPLVGYSLCEHHLGKGRLRSLKKSNSIKRADEVANLSKNSFSSSQLGERVIDEDDSDEKKFGMVMKARSLSTLLGQTMEGDAKNKKIISSA